MLRRSQKATPPPTRLARASPLFQGKDAQEKFRMEP